MMDNISNYQSQLNVFQHIEFDVKDHAYLINGLNAKSVTTILKGYIKAFDSDYWATKKSFELNILPEEILKKWEFNAKCAKTKGTLVHSFIESILTNSKFEYPEEFILKEFGYDPIQDLFKQILPQVETFLQDIENKMIPIATELIIGDSDYLVCGTIDQVFYNKKSGKLEIWDWKTNKEIKTISRYYHLAPLAHIPDTELDHYSLQLSLYKLILEKNTTLELGNSYLTWFNENTNTYKIFKTKDYSEEAQLILNQTNLN